MIRISIWQSVYHLVSSVSERIFESFIYRYTVKNIKKPIGKWLYRILTSIVKLEHRCNFRKTLALDEEMLRSMRIMKNSESA